MFHLFIIGWLGGVWWPGIEVDAPPPKGDPWWWSIAVGVVGGLAAIVAAQVVPVRLDSFVGVVATVAAGAVGGTIARAAMRMSRK